MLSCSKINVSKAAAKDNLGCRGNFDSKLEFKLSHNTVEVRLLGKTSKEEIRRLFARIFSNIVVTGMEVDLEVTRVYCRSQCQYS